MTRTEQRLQQMSEELHRQAAAWRRLLDDLEPRIDAAAVTTISELAQSAEAAAGLGDQQED